MTGRFFWDLTNFDFIAQDEDAIIGVTLSSFPVEDDVVGLWQCP